MEDTAEFKWAVKVVLRRQLRDLVNQLQETGDEIAIMTVNTSEDMYSHFGTSAGEWFISEQRNLTANFLHFCKSQNHKDGKKPTMAGTYENPIVYHPPSKKARKSATLSKSSSGSISSTPQKEITELLEVLIPEQMKQGISDIAIQSLVGRLVAIIMDKDFTAKDNVIPSLSRSGRKIKPKVIDDAGLTKPTPPEGQTILERLASIDTQTLNRVQVKVGSGSFANVATTPIPTSEEMYSLAVAIMNELVLLEKHLILRNKQLKVMVSSADDGCSVKIHHVKTGQEIKHNEGYKTDEDIFMDGSVGDSDMIDKEDLKDEYTEADPEYGPSSFNKKANSKAVTVKKRNQADPIEKQIERRKRKQREPPLSAEMLVKHMERKKKKPFKRQRSAKETTKIPCDHCGLLITGPHNLKAHIEYMHLKIRNSVCTVCNKGFWHQTKLVNHMFDVHTRQCQACKEYVVESEPWQEGTNMRMVRMALCKCGEQVPICTIYGRRAKPESQDEMSGEPRRPRKTGTKYACGVCGKIYNNKRDCAIHAKGHTDQKDHVCYLCGKAFGYDNSLRKHLQNEHNTLQHICEVCGRTYSSEQSLQIHVAKTHKSVELGVGCDVDKEIAKKLPELNCDTNEFGEREADINCDANVDCHQRKTDIDEDELAQLY